MSTDYGLHCRDCNVAWMRDNRKTDMLAVIERKAEYARLYDLLPLLNVEVTAYWMTFSTDLDNMIRFVAAHHTHDLGVIDEYDFQELPPAAWSR